MYISKKQINKVKEIINLKINTIFNEIKTREPAANEKYIRKLARFYLVSNLKGYFKFNKWDEIKANDIFNIIEYIDNFLYQYINGQWYGWTPVVPEDINDSNYIIYEATETYMENREVS